MVPNPQQQHGADITSRLGLASEDAGARAALHAEVIGTINTPSAGSATTPASRSVRSGRSSPWAIPRCTPSCWMSIRRRCAARPSISRARRIITGLRQSWAWNPPAANLFIPKPIFGFVGADALADILLVGMADSDEIELIVDVGTNCEMALGNREKILVASSPAGPAYEDTHMSFGALRHRGGHL